MKQLIIENYELEISSYDRFNYIVVCHYHKPDGEIIFCGKLITNDIQTAIDYFTKKSNYYYLVEDCLGYMIAQRHGKRPNGNFITYYLKSNKNGNYTWTGDFTHAKHFTEKTAKKHLDHLAAAEA